MLSSKISKPWFPVEVFGHITLNKNIHDVYLLYIYYVKQSISMFLKRVFYHFDHFYISYLAYEYRCSEHLDFIALEFFIHFIYKSSEASNLSLSYISEQHRNSP